MADDNATETKGREVRVKASPFQGVGIDEHEGVIEGFTAVTGVVDLDDERILSGAFGKTIAQRKARIPMGLDHEVGFGVTLDMAEVSRGDLPQAIRAESREATGGLWAKGQVMLTDDNTRHLADLRHRMTTGQPVGMSFTFWEVASRNSGHVRDLAEVAVTEWGPIMRKIPRNPLARVLSAKADDADELTVLMLEVDSLLADEKAGRVLRKELLDGLETALKALHRIPKGLSSARMSALEEALEALERIRSAARALPANVSAASVSDGKAKAALVPADALAWELEMVRRRAELAGVRDHGPEGTACQR